MSNSENPEISPQEIDYRETHDVTHIHAAIAREKMDPWSESVPIPLWLMALFGVALFWAGAYLGMFSGGFSGDNFNERSGMGASAKGPGAGPGSEATGGAAESVAEQGKKIFLQNCAVCHQPAGTGIPGQYPPLAKSEYVNGTPKRLAMILLKGLQGPVKVEGATYNGAMPAWEKTLSDKKIAAVLTYIRQEWGNSGAQVEPEQLTAARKLFKAHADSWVEGDLQAVPVDAILEGGTAGGVVKPAGTPEIKK